MSGAEHPHPEDAPHDVPGDGAGGGPGERAPGTGTGPVPTPAMFARSHGAPDHTAFGRVDDAGVVYVRTAEGEREVGSYPGASPAEALAYFARKYDELLASANLLLQRVTRTDISARDAEESHARLAEQVARANVVGDLAALRGRVDEVGAAVAARREAEAVERVAAREQARARREAIVLEAERIAGQPEDRVQWKSGGTRMRELLDEWKSQQRTGPRLDRESESTLWQRFSAARNGFDKARRVHFAQLDVAQGEARRVKQRLVAEAEELATSRDWSAAAGSFKRLMDQWRGAGRAGRADDDALWQRFKSAQDSFFAAKDAVAAAEEASLRENLAVRDALLAEAESVLPVTDLEQAKAALRAVQEKWDRAGTVPRADGERTEKALRRVEQAVRDAEERRWSARNPEAAARAESLVEQLETAVRGLREDLAAAEAAGAAARVEQARAALEARQQWLEQARMALEEFRG